MLAQYDENENDCYICQEKTHQVATDLSLYFCQLHLIYIPLIRWQLHQTIQIYIPSNILCTYGFDMIKRELNNNVTTVQVALFEEDSLHDIRSFSAQNKYPVYLKISDPNNLQIKMFYVVTDSKSHLCETSVDVQLSTVQISSPMTEPLRYFSDHMKEKIKQGLWIPMVTEPLYCKLPIDIKKIIESWQISHMKIFPTLSKLAIRAIFQYDLLTNMTINKISHDVKELLYEIPRELL